MFLVQIHSMSLATARRLWHLRLPGRFERHNRDPMRPMTHARGPSESTGILLKLEMSLKHVQFPARSRDPRSTIDQFTATSLVTQSKMINIVSLQLRLVVGRVLGILYLLRLLDGEKLS